MAVNKMMADFLRNTKPQKPGEKKNVWKAEKEEKVEVVKTPGFSEKAQAYFKKLQEKFGDVNFVFDQNSDGYVNTSGKSTSCFMSSELLEQMAADEEIAAKYEGIIEDALGKLDNLKEQVKEEGLEGYVSGYGIKVNADGSVDYIVMLKDTLQGIKDKKAQQESAHKKNIDKSAEPSGKIWKLEASSAAELLEKLKAIADGRENIAGQINGAKKHSGHANTDKIDIRNQIMQLIPASNPRLFKPLKLQMLAKNRLIPLKNHEPMRCGPMKQPVSARYHQPVIHNSYGPKGISNSPAAPPRPSPVSMNPMPPKTSANYTYSYNGKGQLVATKNGSTVQVTDEKLEA